MSKAFGLDMQWKSPSISADCLRLYLALVIVRVEFMV